MCVRCDPVRRQSWRRDIVEVLTQLHWLPTGGGRAWRTGRWYQADAGGNIDPAPAIDVVWRASIAALSGRDKVGAVIQHRATFRDIMT